MRRLLAGVLLGSVALALPQHALALDYPAPVVPPALRDGTGMTGPALTPEDSTTLPVTGQLATPPPLVPEAAPDDPAYVPGNQWQDGGGGCALWDWDTC